MGKDIVVFLREQLKIRQNRNPLYSLRAFADFLELSPAQLSQIMSYKRTVTRKSFEKISRKLNLSPRERHRMAGSMVGPKQGSEAVVRPQKEMLQAEEEFKLIGDWIHFAILSLANIRGMSEDPRKISTRLGITEREAIAAIGRLRKMKLLSEGPGLKQISDPLNIVSEVPSAAIQKFHQGTISKALVALEQLPIEERDFSSITFPLKQKYMNRYRQLIEEFQKEMAQVSSGESEDRIYMFNCQLFPLDKKEI